MRVRKRRSYSPQESEVPSAYLEHVFIHVLLVFKKIWSQLDIYYEYIDYADLFKMRISLTARAIVRDNLVAGTDLGCFYDHIIIRSEHLDSHEVRSVRGQFGNL